MLYFLFTQSLWLKASSKWRNLDAIYCTEVYIPRISTFYSLWGSELFFGWFTSRKVSVNFSACEQHSFRQMYFFISVSISDLSAALFLTPEAWRKLKKLWWKSQIPSIPKSTLAILSPAFTRRAATWWTCGVYRRIFKSFVPFATEAHWGPLFSDEKVHIPIEQCLQCFWIINQGRPKQRRNKALSLLQIFALSILLSYSILNEIFIDKQSNLWC